MNKKYQREGFVIPDFIQEDIDALHKGMNDPNCGYVDCLIEELAATINSAASHGDITDDDADWLFKVYLHRNEFENEHMIEENSKTIDLSSDTEKKTKTFER